LEDNWKENETLFPIEEAVKKADIILILIADTIQAEVYKNQIEPNMEAGKMIVFSHGFNIQFKQIIPKDNIDVGMIAPLGPGVSVRSEYKNNFGIPAFIAVHQDYTKEAWDKMFALAKALGSTKPGILKTTFKEEVETDLFGEQVILCGGVVEMVKQAFETLVESGYNPAIAYWELHHQLHGIIAPIAYKYGNSGLLNRVSLTAKRGGLTTGKRVMDEKVKENMKACLTDIQSGKFAKEWIEEYKKHGTSKIQEEISQLEKHPLEKIGKQVRKTMWPDEKEHQ